MAKKKQSKKQPAKPTRPKQPATADQQHTLEDLTQESAAWLMGISPYSFRRYRLEKTETGRYDARAIVRFFISRAEDDARADAIRNYKPAEGGDDPLSRKREAEADLMELKLARERGEVISLDVVHSMTRGVLTHVKKAAEVIQRLNSDCYGVLERALDQAWEELERDFIAQGMEPTGNGSGADDADPNRSAEDPHTP